MTARSTFVSAVSGGLALALAMVACTACEADSDRTTSSEASTPTAPGRADAVGPLAVVDYGDGGASQTLGGTGELSISDECVTVIRDNGSKVLPVWLNVSIEWVASSATIRFTQPDGTVLDLNDGDTVTLGGEVLFGDEPVRDGSDIPWIQEPGPGCEGEPFIVSEVLLD